MLGLAIVGTIALVVAGGADASDNGEPATWVNWLKLALGAALLLVAVRQWRGRPGSGDDAPAPKWMRAINSFTPVKALAAGAVLGGVSPKNLLLAVGGAAAIAQTGISAGQQALAYTIFVLIASVGVAAPLVIFFALGARAHQILDGLKTWMTVHNAAIMAALLLVLGAKFIGEAIGGFSA
jgi:hypothetical protein